VDPELRDTLNQFRAELRDEIRSGNAETRAYIDERVGTATAETRTYIDERVVTAAAEAHRHFEVVGESLRSDIRGVAEAVALLSERMDRRDQGQTTRADTLESRVMRLEVRVTSLEDDRKTRRPRRGR